MGSRRGKERDGMKMKEREKKGDGKERGRMPVRMVERKRL